MRLPADFGRENASSPIETIIKLYIAIYKQARVVPNTRVLLNGIPSFNYDLATITRESHRKPVTNQTASRNTSKSPRKHDYCILMALTKTATTKKKYGLYQPRQPPLNIATEPLSSDPGLRPEFHIKAGLDKEIHHQPRIVQ